MRKAGRNPLAARGASAVVGIRRGGGGRAALPRPRFAANRAPFRAGVRFAMPSDVPSHAAEKVDFPAMSSSILDILQAAVPAAGEPPVWVTFMPFIGMAVIFWFFILRPQMRQQKAQREKIASIKRGDQVLTGGGFIGKVVKVDDQYAEVELAPSVKVKALKSTIADVVGPGGSAPAND